jgi:hypothetical protein
MAFVTRLLVSFAMLLAWIASMESPAFAQTPVVIEARVVELPLEEMDQLRTSASPAFVRALSKKMSEYLMDESRSKAVYRTELPATAGSMTQFRLDSRVAADSIGLGIEITPKVFQNRDIVLSTLSQVRVRRDPETDGKQKVIFESRPTKFETRIQEGVTIILGGFITDAERMSLPAMNELPDNPILRYLFGKTGPQQEKYEIAVLLTPRITGDLVAAATDTVMPIVPTNSSVPVAPGPTPGPKPDVVKPPSGIYTVQVGAFDSEIKAQNLETELLQKHADVFIEKITSGAATKAPYRVRVGRLPDMKSARQLQQQLSEEGFDTYITTLK